LLKNGQLDRVVPRKEMRELLAKIIDMHSVTKIIDMHSVRREN